MSDEKTDLEIVVAAREQLTTVIHLKLAAMARAIAEDLEAIYTPLRGTIVTVGKTYYLADDNESRLTFTVGAPDLTDDTTTVCIRGMSRGGAIWADFLFESTKVIGNYDYSSLSMVEMDPFVKLMKAMLAETSTGSITGQNSISR